MYTTDIICIQCVSIHTLAVCPYTRLLCVPTHAYYLRVVASRADMAVRVRGPCERIHTLIMPMQLGNRDGGNTNIQNDQRTGNISQKSARHSNYHVK